jgi:hypothetical protein
MQTSDLASLQNHACSSINDRARIDEQSVDALVITFGLKRFSLGANFDLQK